MSDKAPTQMKNCADCKHREAWAGVTYQSMCTSPEVLALTEFDNGAVRCSEAREFAPICGRAARFFAPKE